MPALVPVPVLVLALMAMVVPLERQVEWMVMIVTQLSMSKWYAVVPAWSRVAPCATHPCLRVQRLSIADLASLPAPLAGDESQVALVRPDRQHRTSGEQATASGGGTSAKGGQRRQLISVIRSSAAGSGGSTGTSTSSDDSSDDDSDSSGGVVVDAFGARSLAATDPTVATMASLIEGHNHATPPHEQRNDVGSAAANGGHSTTQPRPLVVECSDDEAEQGERDGAHKQ